MFKKVADFFNPATNQPARYEVTGNPIYDVETWLDVARHTSAAFNEETIRNSALYTGLQCEELAEKLAAIGLTNIAGILQDTASEFKAGRLDVLVENSLNRVDSSVAMLDADMDLVWVSLGASLVSRFDAYNAWQEVARSNFAKFANGAVVDDNGKIKKPEGWKGPDLTDFV